MKYYILLLLAGSILAGCSSYESLYYDVPIELKDPQLKQEYILDSSPYFSNLKIFLDPGHGGEDRKNRGPEGIAVEADVNLRVALYLSLSLKRPGL